MTGKRSHGELTFRHFEPERSVKKRKSQRDSAWASYESSFEIDEGPGIENRRPDLENIEYVECSSPVLPAIEEVPYVETSSPTHIPLSPVISPRPALLPVSPSKQNRGQRPDPITPISSCASSMPVLELDGNTTPATRSRSDRPKHGKLWNYLPYRENDRICRMYAQATDKSESSNHEQDGFNNHHFGNKLSRKHQQEIEQVTFNTLNEDVGRQVYRLFHDCMSRVMPDEEDVSREQLLEMVTKEIVDVKKKCSGNDPKIMTQLKSTVLFGQDISQIIKGIENGTSEGLDSPIVPADRYKYSKDFAASFVKLLTIFSELNTKLRTMPIATRHSCNSFISSALRSLSANGDQSFVHNGIVKDLAAVINGDENLRREDYTYPLPFNFSLRITDAELPEDSIEAFHGDELRSARLDEAQEADEETSALITDVCESVPILDVNEEDELAAVAEEHLNPIRGGQDSVRKLLNEMRKEQPSTMCVLELAGMGGFSLEIGEKFIRKMNDIYPDRKMVSAKAALLRLQKLFESRRVLELDNRGRNLKGANCYAVYYCENGCMAFTGQFENAKECEVCEQPNEHKFWYLYISPREWIRKSFENKETAKSMLRNRERGDVAHDYNSPYTHVADFWDSEGFRKLKKKKISSMHSKGIIEDNGKRYFETQYEVSLSLAADGVNPWSFRTQEIVTLCLVNNNLDKEVRQSNENVHIPMAFPKVSEKKIMEASGHRGDRRRRPMYDTFLLPLIDDIAEMGIGIKVYDASTQNMVTVKVHLTQVTGDIPAVAHLMQMKGHLAKYPCRTCKSERLSGMLYDDKSDSDRKYGGVLPNQETSQDIRGHDEFLDILKEHERLYNDEKITQSGLAEYQKSHGIRGSSIFFRLGSIEMPWSFVPDAMHMIHVNIAKSMLGLLREEDKCKLNVKGRQALDEVLQQFNTYLPKSLGGKEFPESFFRHGLAGNTKSIVWKRLLEFFPILIHTLRDTLSSYVSTKFAGTGTKGECQEFLEFLLEFTEICNQITGTHITIGKLNQLEKAVTRFERKFRKLYNPDDLLTLNYFTVPLHMLTHTCDYIRWNGMPRYTWCYTMERSCRTIKLIAQGCKFPIKAISNKLLLHSYAKLVGEVEEPRRRSTTTHGKSYSIDKLRFGGFPKKDVLKRVYDGIDSLLSRSMRRKEVGGRNNVRIYVRLQDYKRQGITPVVNTFDTMVKNGTRFKPGDAVVYSNQGNRGPFSRSYGIIQFFIQTKHHLINRELAKKYADGKEEVVLNFAVINRYQPSKDYEYHSQLYSPGEKRLVLMEMASAIHLKEYDVCETASLMKALAKYPLASTGSAHRMVFIEKERTDDGRLLSFEASFR
ncbi:hypothetical protein TRVA0_105S00122 [Trichomonascus vanleenenianus]|uniref:uncharacterized protein n=1 Tax=Trichomonascus vanleenenianus TaxID=2268995 RepID=UPI003ECB5EAF